MRKIAVLILVLLGMIVPANASENKNSDPNSKLNLSLIREANILLSLPNNQVNFAKIKKRAEIGDANSQNIIGHCYYLGLYVEEDSKQAVYWYRKAAEQGLAGAQNSLGAHYGKGEGVEQDYKQAFYWYRKAAEQGLALAQLNLGVCYNNGQGVEQDHKQAVYWYRKAIEQRLSRCSK